MPLSPASRVFLLVATGLTTAIVGLVFYIVFPAIYKAEIQNKLILTPGSETYDNWKQTPLPIYIRFYFFNITNPDEVWEGIGKPVVEELGPYTFREAREKVNITWHENGTVSYRQIKRWFHQPDLTNGSLDDVVTTLNVPMVAAAAKAKEMNNLFVYFAVTEMLSATNSSWFVWKSVKELLFDGYDDPLMSAAKTFVGIPYDKFGWFYKKNNSDDGEFSIFTGKKDLHKFGDIDKWNGSSAVNVWDPPCNMINGSDYRTTNTDVIILSIGFLLQTMAEYQKEYEVNNKHFTRIWNANNSNVEDATYAGDMWPPFRRSGDKLTMFITDICRSMSLSFQSERTIKGVNGYRYWADTSVLDNGKSDPENKCFCEYECLPPGALNVSGCKYDAPAVVSYPHFLFADSIYTQGVIGLRPNPQDHEMFIDIQPLMGIPLSVAARMQINIVFDPIEKIPQFANVTERTYYPIFWFSETASLDDDMAHELKFVLYQLPHIATIISFAIVGIGGLFVLVALIYAIVLAKTNATSQKRLPYKAVKLLNK